MHLREGEKILRVYHHHPTPFVFDVLKVIIGAFPFLMLLFLFKSALSSKAYILANLFIFGLFALVLIYVSLIFWLDKLVITNQRIVHIDWKYLTVRDESEAILSDIQDVITHEKGILSHFRVFDYGNLTMDTSSSYVTIQFEHAPDPESIRQFIYHLRRQ